MRSNRRKGGVGFKTTHNTNKLFRRMRVIARKLEQGLLAAKHNRLVAEYEALKKQIPKFVYISVYKEINNYGIPVIVGNGPAVAAINEHGEHIYVTQDHKLTV